jgi:hypothetical protein
MNHAVAERVRKVFSVQEERKRQYLRLERQVKPPLDISQPLPAFSG